jgi:hypothetical protein
MHMQHWLHWQCRDRLHRYVDPLVGLPRSDVQTLMHALGLHVAATHSALIWHHLQLNEHVRATLATLAMPRQAAPVCWSSCWLTALTNSDFDACAASPCGSNTQCTDLAPPLTNRTCTCNAGYTGNAETGCTGMLVLLLAYHAHQLRL